MSWGAKKSSGSLVKDDLKRIEWIGPAIEKLLHAGGIMTFGDLASSAVETIQEILTAAGKRFQVHNPKTRPEQASLKVSGLLHQLMVVKMYFSTLHNVKKATKCHKKVTM